MKYKYNDTVHLIGYGQVKVIAVNTNESYSNLTTYDLKDVLEDECNTFYSVCDERIERIIHDKAPDCIIYKPSEMSPEEISRALEILYGVGD